MAMSLVFMYNLREENTEPDPIHYQNPGFDDEYSEANQLQQMKYWQIYSEMHYK